MNIAVICENSTEYGRRLADGIGSYAQGKRDWKLRWYNLGTAFEDMALSDCNGIIARIVDDVAANSLGRMPIPVVDVLCLRERPGFIAAMPDNDAIGRVAARHLLSRHYPAFAFIGYRGMLFSSKRLEGFKSELKRNGHEPAEYALELANRRQEIFSAKAGHFRNMRHLKAWLAALPRPVAIFTANDYLAVNILRVASEIGIAVPGEMAILGVDNDRFACAFAETQISSIDPNHFGVGFAAARMLDAAMRKVPDAKNHPAFLVKPKGIMERVSTGHHAVSPDWFASLLDWIDESIGKTISTADLVERAGLSTATVCTTFAKRLGISPLKYITKIKMETAQRLLKDGDLMVKEVAARVGYNSPIRFSIAYSNFWGFPPRKTQS
jgi:LacI family transcriptional regulator